MQYVNEFLSLHCAPDVLAAHRLGNTACKEISESMAIIHALRGITLKHPMEYTLFDLCAGNALTGLIAVHLLPVKSVIAVDKAPRSGNWKRVERFEYRQDDISTWKILPICRQTPFIIVSVHPCQAARDVIRLFLDAGVQQNAPAHLFLMPCCEGPQEQFPALLIDRLTSYERWALTLYDQLGWDGMQCSMRRCPKVLSPANILIEAHW